MITRSASSAQEVGVVARSSRCETVANKVCARCTIIPPQKLLASPAHSGVVGRCGNRVRYKITLHLRNGNDGVCGVSGGWGRWR